MKQTAGIVSRMQTFLFACVALCSIANAATPQAVEDNPEKRVPKALQDAKITEHLGDAVGINDLKFKNEAGQEVALSQYFNKGKPVILTLVYYNCANLCNFLLNGLVESMQKLKWTPGKEFEIVTVTINHRETYELAKAKKESYIKEYGRPEAAKGWHFLSGSEDQIKKLAQQVGFGFRYIPEEKQYAHGSAIFVLTPGGRISRYLYGVMFNPKDLRLSLLEASSGAIGSVVDRILLYCYQYNPQTKKYSMVATRIMQAGGAGTVVFLGGFLMVFWRRQRRDDDA